jgi:hypothetical protein
MCTRSDIDLLWQVDDARQADLLVARLQHWESAYGHRVDGELCLVDGGAVNWREYAGAAASAGQAPGWRCAGTARAVFAATGVAHERRRAAAPGHPPWTARAGAPGHRQPARRTGPGTQAGLVTPFDAGSHHDMDAGTFLRSLFALRHYFIAVADAGASAAPFQTLRRHGIAAEISMLHATAGINTIAARSSALACWWRLPLPAGAARAAPSQPSRSARKCAAGLPSSPAHHWMRTALASARAHGTACRCARTSGRRLPLLREVALPPCAMRWPAACHARPRCARP